MWLGVGGSCSGCFFQAEDGIRDLVRSRGLGDVYKRQGQVGAGEQCGGAACLRAFGRVDPGQRGGAGRSEQERRGVAGACGGGDLSLIHI